MIREKRKKKRRAKKLLIGLLIFLLLLIIAAFIVVKVFVVKNVKVEGNVLYDEQLIKETVLNDEYSWNSLYVFLKYTFVDTKEVPFIDTIEVKLNDPQSITLKVYEKGMMGYLYISSIGENAYFDKDGFVVETSTRVIEDVPRIDGISCDEVVLYEKLPIEDQKLKQILTLTQSLKRDGLEPDSIQYGGEDGPKLYYGDIIVQLGSMELLTQKVERINEILPSLEGLKGTLHMEDWTEESTNIVFEKAPEEVTEDTSMEDTGEDDGAQGETEESTEEAPENNSEESPETEPEAEPQGEIGEEPQTE